MLRLRSCLSAPRRLPCGLQGTRLSCLHIVVPRRRCLDPPHSLHSTALRNINVVSSLIRRNRFTQLRKNPEESNWDSQRMFIKVAPSAVARRHSTGPGKNQVIGR
nr:unnamed protein product [Digitaria exilis]